MDPVILHGLLDTISRALVAYLLLRLAIVSWRASLPGGKIMLAQGWFYFLLALPFGINALGFLEDVTDLLPNINLLEALRPQMWILHVMAFVGGWIFIGVLERTQPRRKA